MNTKDELTVYNDPKYWNHDLRDEFMNSTWTMWAEPSTEVYKARIFESNNVNSPETEAYVDRIEKELEEAVAKLGKFNPTKLPEDIFWEEMKWSRERVIEGAI